MKRIEFLINDIRSMNNVDANGFNDDLLSIYFNEAQKEIRNTIYIANNSANILRQFHYFSLEHGVESYDLPDRIFAENSIVTVGIKSTSRLDETYTPLNKLGISDSGREFGYTIMNNKILIPTRNYGSIYDIRICYNSQLPLLCTRRGKVDSILGNDITLTGNIDLLMTDKTDFLSFIDADGAEKKYDVRLEAQVGPIVTVDDATGITVGDYLLIGEFSTTNSGLPIECEDFLRKYVERRVAIGGSSAVDSSSTNLLTESEKNIITMLFEKSSDDIQYPTISPSTPTV